jgi:chemotaxis protein MotB
MQDEAKDDVEYLKLDNHGHSGGHSEEGEGPWLMSFADMVTLLMCFFILFFSTEKGNLEVDDPIKVKALLEKLSELMNVEVPEEKTNVSPNIKSIASSQSDLDALKETMQEIAKSLDIVFALAQPEPGRIDITFLNSNFFKPGQAEVTFGASRMVEIAALKLKSLPSNAVIEIHGHTDSDPIRSNIFPSNWELSSARAASVLKILAKQGVKEKQMRAVGFAHFQPVAPELTSGGLPNPSNKALNRRIVISITVPQEEKKKQSDVFPKETENQKK